MKEAEDEAQYDEIRQKAEGRIWDQRDAQLKAQRDARDTLMQQVSSSQLWSAADTGYASWVAYNSRYATLRKTDGLFRALAQSIA